MGKLFISTSLKPTMKINIRHLIVFFSKTFIAVGLLTWLLKEKRIDFTLFKTLDVLPSVIIISLCSVMIFFALIIMACRLCVLLRVQNIETPVRRVFSFTLIGALFGAVLPGLVAGDLVKAVYLCRYEPNKRSSVVAAVMADRAIGLFSLMLLGALAIGLAHLTNALLDSQKMYALSFALLIAVMVIPVFLLFGGRLKLVKPVVQRLPRKLDNLLSALILYDRRFSTIALVVLMSLISHGLIVMTFILISILFNDSLSVYMYLVINPLAMVMNVIPLTPGGIGLAESAFSYLYECYGSSNGGNIGLLGRFVQYFVFFSGGITAFIFTRTSDENSSNF